MIANKDEKRKQDPLLYRVLDEEVVSLGTLWNLFNNMQLGIQGALFNLKNIDYAALDEEDNGRLLMIRLALDYMLEINGDKMPFATLDGGKFNTDLDAEGDNLTRI